MKIESNVIANLEAIRREKKIPQKVIAGEFGNGQTAYSNWVRRNEDIGIQKLSRICDILDVSIIDVITYPAKYVDSATLPAECEECKHKQETIDNLNEYIKLLKAKMK